MAEVKMSHCQSLTTVMVWRGLYFLQVWKDMLFKVHMNLCILKV